MRRRHGKGQIFPAFSFLHTMSVESGLHVKCKEWSRGKDRIERKDVADVCTLKYCVDNEWRESTTEST